ncbi:MAG: COX15/CtaA family protein [Acidobacteriota bacterium]|nr:COX15/CtaA family protein [Acidobacteriota bacterium]
MSQRYWLLLCCAVVLAVVVVGGITRLTHSGLSIVEWDPVVGAIPPISQTQWTDAFEKYQRTPEYEKVNRGMSLEAFKDIFWVEWVHRLLGRLIGVVFLVPFLYWLARGRLPRALVPRLVGLFVLGGLQGALGWYMVASGLVDVPRVSPYRLAAHLGLAAIIFGGLFWTALDLWRPQPSSVPVPAAARRLATAVIALVFVTIISGGFVAGTKAGFAFNTFPLMAGRVFPDRMYAGRPIWTNLFENIATVQFNHRLLAGLLCVAIPLLWCHLTRPARPAATRAAAHLLLGWLIVQVTLGIVTLLYVVPVPLAVAHQGSALVLFGLAVLVRHRVRPARPS